MPVIVEGITAPELGKSIGAWVKENTIAIAERVLKEEVAKGFDNQPVVITDGAPRRDYNDVKPFGRIEFARRVNMAEAVLWALDELRGKSPVISGRYVASHIVMINGAEIQGDIRAALINIGPMDRVQIVNTQPYARKIEGGTANKKSGRGKRKALSRQAPNGVYRVVVRELAQRYGRTMFFDFKYVPLNLGVRVWGYQGGGHKRGGKYVGHANRRRVQRDQVYPTLQFFIKPVEIPN